MKLSTDREGGEGESWRKKNVKLPSCLRELRQTTGNRKVMVICVSGVKRIKALVCKTFIYNLVQMFTDQWRSESKCPIFEALLMRNSNNGKENNCKNFLFNYLLGLIY